MLLQRLLEPPLPAGCPGVVVVVVADGRTGVGLFEGLCRAGAPLGGALVRQPPPSHSQVREAASEITPCCFLLPGVFFL